MSTTWRIVALHRGHLEGAVDVHLRAFPTFFLTSLGPRFVRELYRAFADDSGGVALVAEDERGGVLGLVAGSLQPRAFFARLIRRRWWAFLAASAGAVCAAPKILGRLLRAIWYRGGSPKDARRSLLSCIAVSPTVQGMGIGAALLQAWLREVEARGSGGCFLTTDAENNQAVNRFYRRLGWTLESVFVTPEGRRMNRYILDFPGRKTSEPKRRAA